MLRVSGRRLSCLARRSTPATSSSSFFASKNPIHGDYQFVNARSFFGSPMSKGIEPGQIRRTRVSGCSRPLMLNLRCSFSATTSQFPPTTDPDITSAFKDLMALSWDQIPDSVVDSTKKALAKITDDKVGQEALANFFCAAEASVEFGGVLVDLRMAFDDLSGVTGENVNRLPEDLEDALKAAYKRYMAYLDSFNADEAYLRKKVETVLGSRMMHLKMRCTGIGSEWGKVTLIGTSGISGSYIEQRA